MHEFEELEKAVQDMVLGHPAKSAEQICIDAFGVNPDTMQPSKSHWTLYKELNPHDATAKLGYLNLIQLMRATDDMRPAEIMADMLGYKLSPKAARPDGEDMRHESLQAVHAMDDFIRAANDPDVPYAELVAKRLRAAKEADDVLERRNPDYEGHVMRGGEWEPAGARQ